MNADIPHINDLMSMSTSSEVWPQAGCPAVEQLSMVCAQRARPVLVNEQQRAELKMRERETFATEAL